MGPLKLVILDRDGTINADRDDFVKSPEEWEPLPGLYEQIGARYGIDLRSVPAVGDSLRDLQAAAAVGCETHLVRTGKCAGLDTAQLDALVAQVPGTLVHADLAACAEFIVQRDRHARAQARGTPNAPDSGPTPLAT